MIESTRVLSHSLQISLHEVRFGSVFDADSKRIRSLPAQRRDAVRIGLARHARRSESDQKQPERAGYSLRLASTLRGVVAAPPSQHSPSSSHFDWLLGSSTECSSSPSSPPRWSWSSVRDRSKTPFATRSSETSRFPWRQRSGGCCRSRERSGFASPGAADRSREHLSVERAADVLAGAAIDGHRDEFGGAAAVRSEL